MAGHSKWHNIMHKKGAADAKRSSAFAKLSKDIIVATQMGASGDINFNPYLRVLVQKAKSMNMTNDKIEKAINKGLGKTGGDESIVEKTYEAYGFGGALILVDCETDNPNRTLTEVRTILTRLGCKMVSEGSISWQFEEQGFIKLKVLDKNLKIEDDVVIHLMDLSGVIDISYDEGLVEIYLKRESLKEIVDFIKSNFNTTLLVEELSIIKVAKNKVELSDQDLEKNADLIEKIKDVAEVVNVWTNIN